MDSTSEGRSLRHEEPRCGADAIGRLPPPPGGRAVPVRHSSHGPHWQAARGLERPAGRGPASGDGERNDPAESAQRLLSLTGELGRLAAEIAEGARSPSPTSSAVDSKFIRQLIRARQRRVAAFGADLFADPAWDMMLDLLAARLEGRSVSTSSLCIAAGVPGTTALRWIRLLTERGLFVRTADPRDGRGVLIELSDHAAERLMAHLAASSRALSV